MTTSILKKRKHDETRQEKRPKKVRKQQRYSSPSSDSEPQAKDVDFTAVNLADSDSESNEDSVTQPKIQTSQQPANDETSQTSPPSSSADSASDSETSLTPSNTHTSTKSKSHSKRNDPSAFASSISAILSSKLTTDKRPDPVLARSASAKEANASIANSKLESKARKKMREDKKAAMDKGRIKDVLLGDMGYGAGQARDYEEGGGERDRTTTAAELAEYEKSLKKTAQRGVIKLFNAVRAAQVKAEEAKAKGGTRGRKEERMDEMSKEGFLEMVAAGGKSNGAKKIVEKEIHEA